MIRNARKEIADRLTKHLHLDVRFYGRALSWMSLSHSSAILRGIATTFIMARILPTELFGQFRYVLAIFGIASTASLAGMSNAVIQGVAKGDTSIARAACKKILLFSPVGSVILIGFAIERFFKGEFSVAWSIAITALIFPIYSISSLYSDILFGEQKVKKLSQINSVINIVFVIGFLPILFLSHDLFILTLVYLGLDAGIRAFLTIRSIQSLSNIGNPEIYLRTGKHLSVINIIQAIAGRIDQVLIQFFGGYGSLASYSVAILIPEQIKSFVKSSGGVFLQRLSRHEENEKNVHSVQRHFWTAMVATALGIGCYLLVIPFLLPFLFPQYADATLPTMLYAIGLISLPSVIGINYFSAHNNIRSLWRFHISNAVIQIIGTIVLVPMFGGWGGIWARTITRLATLPLSFPRISKKLSTNDIKNTH